MTTIDQHGEVHRESHENRREHATPADKQDATEDTGEHPFRKQGALEQKYGIEAQKPTPITKDAKERFESWGVPEAFIQRLREMTSSMRYDLCVQKAEQIAERGGYIPTRTKVKIDDDSHYYEYGGDDEDIVTLPDFYNNEDRFSGGCGDISIQFLKLLHSSGYLDELNQILADKQKPPLHPCFVNGLSRTHFNTQFDDQRRANHIWIGLLPEGSNEEDMVTVDAAFQEISNTENNGYKPINTFIDPSRIDNLSVNAAYQVGAYAEVPGQPDDPYIHPKVLLTLGISADRQVNYELTFLRDGAKDGDDSEIHPAIAVFPPFPKPGDNVPVCIGRRGKEPLFLHAHDLAPLHALEVRTILDKLSGLELVEDNDKVQKALAQKESVSFR